MVIGFLRCEMGLPEWPRNQPEAPVSNGLTSLRSDDEISRVVTFHNGGKHRGEHSSESIRATQAGSSENRSISTFFAVWCAHYSTRMVAIIRLHSNGHRRVLMLYAGRAPMLSERCDPDAFRARWPRCFPSLVVRFGAGAHRFETFQGNGDERSRDAQKSPGGCPGLSPRPTG